jgi:phage shock protein A
MKERLSNRVGRIVSGSLNALVDAVEGAAPELVMEEAVREIDGAIDEVRTELGRTIADRHLAGKRLADENRRHQELTEQIAIAVAQSRDDLAETGIARQLDIEAQLPVLEQAIAAATEQERELEGYVQALQAKRREMREELARLAERRREAAALGGPSGAGGSTASGGDRERRVARAESAFDRVLERETGLAAGRPDSHDAAKLAELEDLARRNRIAERLAAVKAGRF